LSHFPQFHLKRCLSPYIFDFFLVREAVVFFAAEAVFFAGVFFAAAGFRPADFFAGATT
jgi:hypothetical protein